MTLLVEPGAVGRTVALVLAQNPVPPADKGEEFGKASPIGLVVILLLGIATVLLIRNMTKRIRKLPASFDPPSDSSAASADPPGPAAPSDDAHGPSARPADTSPERSAGPG